MKDEMLSPSIRKTIDEKILKTRPQFTFELVGGISIVLLGTVIAYLMDPEVFNIETYQASVFLTFIAVGAFMIIHGSILYGSLQTFKTLDGSSSNSEFQSDFHEKKEEIIMTIFMIGATTIYLYLGFTNPVNFGIYWYVFPIAALIGYLVQLMWKLFQNEKPDNDNIIISLFMVGATIIYLYSGFTDVANFRVTWYVFPLAGLLGYLCQLIYNLLKK